MNSNDLSLRIEKLERQFTNRRPRLLGSFFVCLIAVSLLLLLTANVWLCVQLVNDSRETQLEHHFWLLCQGQTTPARRAEAFQTLMAAGNTEWRSARLEGVDLSHISFSNTLLEGLEMRAAQLRGCDFSHSKIADCGFELANLNGAKFSEAVAKQVDFFKANLENASFRQANFTGVNLEQVSAARADFMLCKLGGANLLMADFSDANLSGADLSECNLEVANLSRCNLTLANLRGARFRDTQLTDSNWWRARGLSLEQIGEFSSRFAPAADSPLRQDYDNWLTQNNLKK